MNMILLEQLENETNILEHPEIETFEILNKRTHEKWNFCLKLYLKLLKNGTFS